MRLFLFFVTPQECFWVEVFHWTIISRTTSPLKNDHGRLYPASFFRNPEALQTPANKAEMYAHPLGYKQIFRKGGRRACLYFCDPDQTHDERGECPRKIKTSLRSHIKTDYKTLICYVLDKNSSVSQFENIDSTNRYLKGFYVIEEEQNELKQIKNYNFELLSTFIILGCSSRWAVFPQIKSRWSKSSIISSVEFLRYGRISKTSSGVEIQSDVPTKRWTSRSILLQS